MSPRDMNRTEGRGLFHGGWGQQLGGAAEGPFRPSNRALFSARWRAVLTGPRNVRALRVHPPGGHGSPRVSPQAGGPPGLEWAGLPSWTGTWRAGPSVSTWDLPLPTQTGQNNCNGGGRPCRLTSLHPRGLGKVSGAEGTDRGPIPRLAWDPESRTVSLGTQKQKRKPLRLGAPPPLALARGSQVGDLFPRVGGPVTILAVPTGSGVAGGGRPSPGSVLVLAGIDAGFPAFRLGVLVARHPCGFQDL